MGRRRAEPGRCPWGPSGLHSLWPLALLEASILSSCFLWTTAQAVTTKHYNITVFKDPPEPIERRTVHFTLGDIPSTPLFVCKWFRGPEDPNNLLITAYLPPLNGTTNGPAFSGRETTGTKCSLLISNLTLNDTGLYTVTMDGPNVYVKGLVTIQVLEELLTPVLSTEEYFWREEYFVPEKANATLRCNTFSSPRITISWFQDGGPLPEAQLSDQNRTLTLLSLTRNDTRRYTCVVSNHIRNVTSNAVTITVSYGPEAAMLNQPESVIKPLGSTLVLLCNTSDSVPKPKLQWWFNNTLQAEMNDTFHDTFHVQLKAWEDEGNYTCQAVNPITHAVVQAFVYVKLEDDPGGISVGTIVGIVLGSVAGLVLSVGIGYFLCTKATCGRMEQHTTNGNMSSTPGRNEATDGKSITAEEDIQYSTLAIKINNSAQPASGFAQPLENSTVYSEIKKT